MNNSPFNSRYNEVKRRNYQRNFKVKDNLNLGIDKQIKEFLESGGKIQHVAPGVSAEIYGLTRRQQINRTYSND